MTKEKNRCEICDSFECTCRCKGCGFPPSECSCELEKELLITKNLEKLLNRLIE